VTATEPSVSGLYVGSSGWSYPTWRPDFYPAGTKPGDFLRYYAERFPTVELNTTGYRLPAEEQFARWAEQTREGFRFAPKLNGHARAPLGTFAERVALLGERLGPVRVLVTSARDDGLLALLQGSFDPALKLAFDFRHDSWNGVEGVRVVNELGGPGDFRYLRLREPPYSDEQLAAWAGRISALLSDGLEVYVYFKHEDEPTAPRYAEKLIELVRSRSR
jgi:uncharacterized protein YecE (DUF72 family)